MKIRFAGEEDLAFLSSHDGHISAKILRERVAQECVYIAEENGAPVGWLRYNLFWDNTPFCNLIFVSEKARGRGGGRRSARCMGARHARSGILCCHDVDAGAGTSPNVFPRKRLCRCGRVFPAWRGIRTCTSQSFIKKDGSMK